MRYVKREAGRANSYTPLRVLIYSSDADFRMQVQRGLGRSPDVAIAPLEYIETATAAAVFRTTASGTIDLAVLDGEATPCGGIGLAKQLKDELLQYLPIVVLVGRPDDAWLASWARADAVLSHPVDPFELRAEVLPLLRSRMLV